MTEHSIVLLVCLAVIVILATLLYAAGRGYLAALARFGEFREMLGQIMTSTRNAEQSLRQQRRVLYDAHKRISAVTKGVEKRPS
jgi:hypothetical protein